MKNTPRGIVCFMRKSLACGGVLAYNKGMNAVNYDAVMQKMIAAAPPGRRLLLHSCCAPCSSYCLEQLHEAFRVTVYYFNPNLDSEEEYLRRKGEQIRLLRETGWADILDCDHAPETFAEISRGRETMREGGERCLLCYRLRLSHTARAAREGGYDLFATTLTVSPLKNAAKLNEIGYALQEEYGVAYLPSDFKKRGGYLRSVELSRRYGLYRQNYCGCVFSKAEMFARGSDG